MSTVTIAILAFAAGTWVEPLFRKLGIGGISWGGPDTERPGWWLWANRLVRDYRPAPWNKDTPA